MVRPVDDEQNEPLLAEYTQDEVRAPASPVVSQCPQSAHLCVPLLTALRGCGTVFQREHAVCVWPSSHHTDCHACGWGVPPQHLARPLARRGMSCGPTRDRLRRKPSACPLTLPSSSTGSHRCSACDAQLATQLAREFVKQ
jgi:hypothetical protein